MIGIVGGIGPLAGIDLYQRIIEHTSAQTDQDHLPVLLASLSNEIGDRTQFLLGNHTDNPAKGIAKVVSMLENAGAKYIGIACNTAHAPAIFQPMLEILRQQDSKAEILHLIEITLQYILAAPSGPKRIGLMMTSGAYQTGIYQNALIKAGLTPVTLPLDRHNELIHEGIYVIKQEGRAVNTAQVDRFNTAIMELQELGAQAVILGCTEIGMIEHKLQFNGLMVFNPNAILARELIARIDAGKLKMP